MSDSDICPYCGARSLELRQMEDAVPFFGRVLIVTSLCRSCGYRHSDTIPLTDRGPRRYVLRISKLDDLKKKIARSDTSSIEIPELGLRLDPGCESQSFITNIEGLLQRFEDAAIRLKVLRSSDESRELDELIDKIRLAREGKIAFTVIVEDPLGNTVTIEDYSVT